ncbi:MAG: ATP-grasp domain-containing protein [Phycisphaerales bacterium]|nr:MAG: ATP-grasp domain-containing protein [Phycisphaerales bacterium]
MNALVVVDRPERWPLHVPGTEVVASRDYLTDPRFAAIRRAKVFNLCRSYRYQSAGYYVSLLAAARGHTPWPSVGTILDFRLSPIIRIVGHELDDLVRKSLAPLKSDEFELSIYFGRNMAHRYDRLSLALFNQFPAPFLRAVFVKEDKWNIESVRIIGAGEIPEDHRPFAIEQAERFLHRPTRRGAKKTQARYDLAILVNEHEEIPPSDPPAIKKFLKAAEAAGFRAELIHADDAGRIAEFDALLIRETTAVDHHTYRISRRAEAEGLAVIDDPHSILRCANKVFLAELMTRHGLATPETIILSKDRIHLVAEKIGFPCVIKRPDEAFSRGVIKVDTEDEFHERIDELFDGSELLIAQEFAPTEFDWRIGVLGGEAIFACKYFMARKHWQILQHHDKGVHEGGFESFSLDDAPRAVVSLAVKAAKLIGDGLYGVDIKVLDGKPKIIEVNDNPSIDSGVEDKILGDWLYRRIVDHLLAKIESSRR